MEHNEPLTTPPEEPSKPVWRYLLATLKWARRIVLLLLFLFFLAVLALQLPAVQNWAAQKAAAALSEATQTTVAVGQLDFAFFDELLLEQLYVEDFSPGDTMLYSERLYANFDLNPLTYFWRGLVIEEIRLDNAEVNLRKRPEATESNIQILLQRLTRPDTTLEDRVRRPFRLDVKRLGLSNIRFVKEDKQWGKGLDAFLYEGDLSFKTINLPERYVHAETISLTGPFVNVLETQGTADSLMADSTLLAVDSAYQKPFHFTAEQISVSDGKFSLHNYRNEPERLAPTDQLDYQHMDVHSINFGVKYFSFCEDSLDFAGQIQNFSLQALSGFTLENLSSERARVWCKGAELYGLSLKTPYSELGDTLTFAYDDYSDWLDFPNKVNMGIHVNNSSVTLSDIMTFAPKLWDNPFFANNANRKLYLDGLVRGRVGLLRGYDISINLEGQSLALRGSFDTRDLNVPAMRAINLDLESLTTDVTTIEQLFPRFRPPDNLKRLGRLQFNGNFDLIFGDIIADGDLRTNIGRAVMDMQMEKINQAREQVTYNGSLTLMDFDLGVFSGNPDLGKVGFSAEVLKGSRGLTAESADAILIAQVDSFYYRNYVYRDAQMKGELRKNLFEGHFEIADKNIDFTFDGNVDLTGEVPSFDFNAAVKKLNLQRLNLVTRDISVTGDIKVNVQDASLSKLRGGGSISNIEVVHRENGATAIKDIQFFSGFHPNGSRFLSLESDLATAKLIGSFDIEQVPAAFLQFLTDRYPDFAKRLGISPPKAPPGDHQMAFDLRISDTKNLLTVIDPQLERIEGGYLQGFLDNKQDSLVANLYLPAFGYGNLGLNNVNAKLRLDSRYDSVFVDVEDLDIRDKRWPGGRVVAELGADTVQMALAYESEGMALDLLDFKARLYMPDSLNYRVEFEQSKLVLLETPWLIDADNAITFRKGYVATENFLLVNGAGQRVQLNALDGKGLELNIDNLDFDLINELWDYEPLYFAGAFRVKASTRDLFNLTGITAQVLADTLLINEDDWGGLDLALTARDLKSPLYADLLLQRGQARIMAEGFLNLAERKNREKGGEEKNKNYFDLAIDADGLPVSLAEYWLAGTVSNTVGQFKADLRIFGMPGSQHIEGDAVVKDGATTIDFLKTRYFIPEGTLRARDFLFDATGVVVKDKYGKKANLRGGITHEYLKNLGIDLVMDTKEFLALDTKKADNELFYGHAIGAGKVTFKGPLNKVDIYVNATVDENTRLVIPVSYGSEASQLSFIQFEQQQQDTLAEASDDRGRASPKGVSLEMDLEIRDKAICEIIFDEQAGDIIKGRGRGNVRILVPRNGGFQMFGDYIIEEGDYLFTLYNVVNKKFIVKKGGTVRWSGDPFEAKIRLEAEYTGISTSLSTFIQEYLADARPEIQSAARTATPVDLTMDLRGDLMRPIINFDIDFPQLVGPLEAYADSKLRVIRQDANELNRQVFGLIVAGQFLPSDFSLQGTDIFYNTVSEFVSNQLSLLLTELFSEFFNNEGSLSGLDFDIAYNQYQSIALEEGTETVRGDEFQVRLKQDFFDNRLTVLVGGNVDIGNGANATVPEATGAFVGNDLVIEYAINKDQSVKMRVYQRLEPDIGGGSRLEVGTGLSFRREFDTLEEFVQSFRQKSKR